MRAWALFGLGALVAMHQFTASGRPDPSVLGFAAFLLGAPAFAVHTPPPTQRLPQHLVDEAMQELDAIDPST